ncbi:hypothetical protein C5167_048522 [Papaver somniferum]|uniref:Uncharacterized protein n=1 Tax=Papaver somniferum TaxID=3469 RepID=A0A4Y7KLR5_PAPSO|nr:hypothetical protein C5167_048522 [Papaver somniferum]
MSRQGLVFLDQVLKRCKATSIKQDVFSLSFSLSLCSKVNEMSFSHTIGRLRSSRDENNDGGVLCTLVGDSFKGKYRNPGCISPST